MIFTILILVPCLALFITGAVTELIYRRFPSVFGVQSHILNNQVLNRFGVSFFVWAVVCSGCYYLAGWIL